MKSERKNFVLIFLLATCCNVKYKMYSMLKCPELLAAKGENVKRWARILLEIDYIA